MKIIKKIRKKIKVTNSHQYNRIVEFMVENPTFATYAMVINAKDKIMYNRLWEKLSVQLNLRGPPIRNMDEWKKVWVDYKHNIKKKCHLKQRFERIRRAEGTENYKEIKFSNNETAIKELIFDTPIGRSKFSDCQSRKTYKEHNSSTISTTNKQEEASPTIKTELSDMFIDVTEQLQLIDTISPPKSSLNFDKATTLSQSKNQPNMFEEHMEIEKQLHKLKKEKRKISRQAAEIKQMLQEKLDDLKEQKFELKRQQFKYKAQKLELKKKELQMKEDAKLRNSINCNYKKT